MKGGSSTGTSAFGDRITRERVSDVVAAKLTDIIANGTLRPGEVLPNELELAEQFGVGNPRSVKRSRSSRRGEW